MKSASGDRVPAANHKNLLAWQQARQLAVITLVMAGRDPLRRSRALSEQMQRSALSIPSNLAEGEERGSNKDALRFLFISKGSLAEFRTQLEIGYLAGLISREDFDKMESLADHVARLISGLIKRRIQRGRSISVDP